jgi:hypothetical protein
MTHNMPATTTNDANSATSALISESAEQTVNNLIQDARITIQAQRERCLATVLNLWVQMNR